MADYEVTDFVTADDRAEVVAAALETQLETLDSTSNPIRLITIQYDVAAKKFVGILITEDA